MHYKYAHPEFFDGVSRPNFKSLSGNLVIYGAGFQGLLTAYLLEQQGIKMLCFGDQDVKKQGTTYYGLPVYSPEEMRRKYPEAVPIVTPYNLRPALEYVKNDLGYPNAVTPFSLFLEFDSTGFDNLQELPAWYHAESLDYTVNIFFLKCIEALTECQLFATDISVTEVCNLRCKECTSLMPCYQFPRHFEYESILSDAHKLLHGRLFSHIFIEGGEPFLWEHLPHLVQELCAVPELMLVIIVTNGTVIPNVDMLDALQNPKVLVRISDYGRISKKEQLMGMLRKRHINCALTLQKWYKASAFTKEAKTSEQFKHVIESCCKLQGHGAEYVLNGKLFRCPIQGNLHELGIFPSSDLDYVDLRVDDGPELQEKITKFFTQMHIPKICRHCNGRGYTGIEVPPAQQLAPGETIQVRFE